MSEKREFEGTAGELADPVGRTEEPIEFDQLFSLLSTRRRRYALYCLAEASETTLSTTDLVDELATFEPTAENEAAPRREIELSLRHTHLPKLDDADVVDYDAERSVATYCGGPRVDRWLTRTMDAECSQVSD